MPESPRWLVKEGRVNEARDLLERLRNKTEAQSSETSSDTKSAESPSEADRELADIIDVVALEKAKVQSLTYYSMFFGIGGLSLTSVT